MSDAGHQLGIPVGQTMHGLLGHVGGDLGRQAPDGWRWRVGDANRRSTGECWEGSLCVHIFSQAGHVSELVAVRRSRSLLKHQRLLGGLPTVYVCAHILTSWPYGTQRNNWVEEAHVPTPAS